MIVKRFMKLLNPQGGFYSHSDQSELKLKFRVFYSDDDVALYLIVGPAENIQCYMHRFNSRIAELNDTEMKEEMDNYAPARTDTCQACLGSGTIEVPAFDPVTAKEELS